MRGGKRREEKKRCSRREQAGKDGGGFPFKLIKGKERSADH
jgi:hypothetical protein